MIYAHIRKLFPWLSCTWLLMNATFFLQGANQQSVSIKVSHTERSKPVETEIKAKCMPA